MKKSKLNKIILIVIFLLLIVLLVFMISKNNYSKEKSNLVIRKPAVAGAFYSNSQAKLEKQLDLFFEKADSNYNNEKIDALIVPHAGYIYSGQTAMFGYKKLYYDLMLRDENNFKVIIIAPSHQEYFSGYSITACNYYQTPFGKVKLADNNLITNKLNYKSLQEKEHSIEVQLPFLQYIFKKLNKDFEILPILIGDIDNNKEILEISKLIEKEITPNTIIIVSSDLSHYLPKDKANLIDKKTINNILENKTSSKEEIDACGRLPILILSQIAKDNNWKNKLINYSDSGDITKDKSAVVGYSSISYFEDYNSQNTNHILKRIAKASISNEFTKREDNFKDLTSILPKEYLEKKGVFVTLTLDEQLRGCIGNIIGKNSVFESVIENSKLSAFDDSRFLPLTKEEFEEEDFEIEISILSIPAPCSLEEIKVGEGVILQNGFNSALYLPQVWEQLPDKNKFLSSLCQKAGLSKECYKEKETKFKKFNVEII
ncbi:MAG: AmmeMemoRadiSam system protein B [archaeon]